MNILAIDTTTKKAEVSLALEDSINTYVEENEITHSEKLMPLVDKALKSANFNLNNVDCIACTIGPGSFTGVRIAIATVKALTYVLNIPIFAMNTLELMARSADNISNKYILSVLDAKNSRAYYALYTAENFEVIIDCKNKTIEDILEEIKNLGVDMQDVLVVSNNQEFLNLHFSNTKLVDISTKKLCECVNLEDRQHITDNMKLDAVYARVSQAQRQKYGE